MSVLLVIRQDVYVGDGDFASAIQKAFPPSGVDRMLKLPTLQWKIWAADPDRRQTCGFYLFADRSEAEKYAYQAVRTLQEREGIFNVTTQIWSINEEKTRMTKGPIDVPMIQDLT